MFNLPSINAFSLVLASLSALIYDYYLVDLLHQRYDHQFGKSFMLSGLMAFSLPVFGLIAMPIYFLLESKMPGVLRGVFLLSFASVLWVLMFLLKRRLLTKIFLDPQKSPKT